MEDKLHRIRNWANRGTLLQFYSELSGKLAKTEYEAEMKGDAVRFYRVKKSGGFLGVGAKKQRDLVLEVVRKGTDLRVPPDTADPAFVDLILPMLGAH